MFSIAALSVLFIDWPLCNVLYSCFICSIYSSLVILYDIVSPLGQAGGGAGAAVYLPSPVWPMQPQNHAVWVWLLQTPDRWQSRWGIGGITHAHITHMHTLHTHIHITHTCTHYTHMHTLHTHTHITHTCIHYTHMHTHTPHTHVHNTCTTHAHY